MQKFTVFASTFSIKKSYIPNVKYVEKITKDCGKQYFEIDFNLLWTKEAL